MSKTVQTSRDFATRLAVCGGEREEARRTRFGARRDFIRRQRGTPTRGCLPWGYLAASPCRTVGVDWTLELINNSSPSVNARYTTTTSRTRHCPHHRRHPRPHRRATNKATARQHGSPPISPANASHARPPSTPKASSSRAHVRRHRCVPSTRRSSAPESTRRAQRGRQRSTTRPRIVTPNCPSSASIRPPKGKAPTTRVTCARPSAATPIGAGHQGLRLP